MHKDRKHIQMAETVRGLGSIVLSAARERKWVGYHGN